MTPDAIAEELRRLRGEMSDQLADIQVALTRIREEIRRPHPVETIDLGKELYMPEIFGEEQL